jgi:hypothetical protein
LLTVTAGEDDLSDNLIWTWLRDWRIFDGDLRALSLYDKDWDSLMLGLQMGRSMYGLPLLLLSSFLNADACWGYNVLTPETIAKGTT